MRKAGTAVLLAVGTLLWIGLGVGLWAERQALDTEEWVDTSGELLEDEEVRTAIGLYIVDRLYDSEQVQARIEEVLPPRLDPLAAPAAAGLKQVAQRAAPRLLGSEVAVSAWREANEAAHGELLALVEGERGGILTLELGTLFEQVAEGTGLPPEVVDRLPPEVASLRIASGENLRTAQDALDLFETLVWILLALSVVCFAGAIALSRDRRRTVLNVGACLMFAAVAILAVRRLAGREVVDVLADAPNAMGAADDAWDIATSLLVDVAQGSFLFGLFVVTGAWLAGAGRRATALRRGSAFALREHAGLVRAGLGVAILLLVIWGPVPWTQRFWTIVIFTVIAFAWLEWIRRRTLEEFPDQPAPRVSWRSMRAPRDMSQAIDTGRSRTDVNT
jgi:hypothetical protein